MERIKAVILAAGKGTRMESELPKVIHEVSGKPMINYVIDAVNEAGVVPSDICLVVGYKAKEVKEVVGNKVSYVMQEEQLGTGHAVRCASDFIGTDGITIVLCGDTPLITAETLKKLVRTHIEEKNAITVLTAVADDPSGYGRIIKDNWNKFVKIVEQKDATLEEQRVDEINSGMYVFNSEVLSKALSMLTNHNAQGEYYLTDTIEIVKTKGLGEVSTMVLSGIDEIKGVNSLKQLAEAEVILKKEDGMKLIVGLGNPTAQYAGTRHNVGFEVIDEIAKQYNIDVDIIKHKGVYGKGKIEGQNVILLKPMTFMNLSGESVVAVANYYKILPEDIIVIYDDINLDVGRLRIREKGSAGGHNGIKNIIAHLGTEAFPRIRVGVGMKPSRMDLADYVLSRFSKDEKIDMIIGYDKAVKASALMIKDDVAKAMNDYNGK